MPIPGNTTLGIDVGGSSVKAAGFSGGKITWTAKSQRYASPTPERLAAAMREVVEPHLKEPPAAVGLCVPGILDAEQTKVVQSVNVPGLNGVSLSDLISDALGSAPARLRVLSDATATAYDLYASRAMTGRLFALVLGTGVGVCVMDEAGPLRVDGDSPGHFGQMDVSIEGHPVVGPDGGAGSLEGYIGSAALRARYGGGPQGMQRFRVTDPPGRALVRAIRIAHAMYRPHHMVIAGGVGIRLNHVVPSIRQAVNRQLTSIARPDWTLSVGDNDFHAAAGAARAVCQALADSDLRIAVAPNEPRP